MNEAAGSDLDKAAELVGTVKQFLKVMEARSAELVNEQKADLILNREQLAKLRDLMGKLVTAAQASQKELGHFLEEDVRGLILAHVEDAASAAGRAQAQQFGKEVAAEASQGARGRGCSSKQRGPIVATSLSAVAPAEYAARSGHHGRLQLWHLGRRDCRSVALSAVEI